METNQTKLPESLPTEIFYNTTLPKLRTSNFKIINQTTLVISFIYVLVVLLSASSLLLTKFLLALILINFGLTIVAVFAYFQEQEFTKELYRYIIFSSMAVLFSAVHLSGGLESPFLFFYILILFFASLTLSVKEALYLTLLVAFLSLGHFFLPVIDTIKLPTSTPFGAFLTIWSKILIISLYGFLLISDLIRKNDRLLSQNSAFDAENRDLKRFNLITRAYQSLGTLRGTLNYETLKQLIPMTISKLLKSDVALLFLKEDGGLRYVSSWRSNPEALIPDSTFSQCSLEHGDSCIISRLDNLERIFGEDARKFLKNCSPSCSDTIQSFGAEYFVLAPLKVANQNLGALVLGFSSKKVLGWDETEVLKLFTYTNVLAIENARFYSKTRENFEKYSAILTELIDAVVVVERSGKITLINAQAEKLLGVRADVVGKQVTQVLFSLDEAGKKVPKEDTAINKALESEEAVNIPKRFYKKPDGNLVPVTVSAKSIKDNSGIPIGVMLLIRNLSEQIEFERTRNEFISLASIELQTPLADMRGLLERIRQDPSGKLSEEQKSALALAYRGNERLGRLVADLLKVSQIDKGSLRVNKKVVNIGELTKTAVEDYIYQAKRKKQHLAYKMPRKSLKIRTDPAHVREVLAIMLGNAIKYTKTGGEITVYHQVGKDRVTTFVKDTGPLIPNEVLPNLYKKFYRDPKLIAKTEGTGLGLYIARELVEILGGSVLVKSSPRIGVIFSFSLPNKIGKGR